MKRLQLSTIVSSCCIYFIILTYYLGSGIFILLLFAVFEVRYAILGTIAILLFYRIRFPFEFSGAFELRCLRKNIFTDIMQKQQPWHTVYTTELDVNTRYMFVCSPHGMLPISWFFFLFHLARIGFHPLPMMGDIVFRLPYVREFTLLFGGVNANWKSVELASKNDRNLLVIPGAAREMKYSGKSKDTITVVKRTGFIKAALEYGYSLVPVMGVGVDDLYQPYVFEWEWYKRMFGHYLFIAMGRFDIIYPRKAEVYNIVGKPMYVAINKDPSKEEIQELSDQFYEELESTLLYYNRTNNKSIKLEYTMK